MARLTDANVWTVTTGGKEIGVCKVELRPDLPGAAPTGWLRVVNAFDVSAWSRYFPLGLSYANNGLTVTAFVYDAYGRAAGLSRVAFHFDLPAFPGERDAVWIVRECLQRVILHELDEALRYGGERAFDPHLPDGMTRDHDDDLLRVYGPTPGRR